MGGRGRSRTQRKHFSQSRENAWKRPKSDASAVATAGDANNGENRNWQPFMTQNPAFDEYYKEQGIVPAEEWDTFIKYLRTPLPAAFRINSSCQFYKDIRFRLENDFMKSLPAEDTDGNAVEAIKVLPWYPDNLAWQSYYSRNQLRKNQALEQFHEFLKLENEIGNITRQEAVSMVPPLFLDVRPDHFVLDMCAAPGSKTFQLLEMIYKLTEPGTLPSGMVVANDLDVQRCNLLIHQTKRMCTANLIVTNHEAQHFPSCQLYRNVENVKELGIRQLQFDRVLCDVPCSGDGTLRKAPDMWKKWNSGMANGLFGLQVQIAMRGLALLKVGGRMVYSTCSMNPVENEAVVAEVLRRCKGTVELVDVSTELPQLARRPGIKIWKVRDKGLWLTSYKDVRRYRQSVATPGMFPSGKSYDEISEPDQETATGQICENSNDNNEKGGELIEDSVAPTSHLEAEVSDLPLQRCMRIVPHDQNSGAFFIAVFHKRFPLPAPTVIQKKSKSWNGTDSSSSESRKRVKVKEDRNGDDIDVSGETDVQISEAATDASLLDTGIGEHHLNSDHNKIHEQNEKEDKNGDYIDVSGETDVQISEAALDANLLDTGMGETHSNTDQNKIHEQNEKEDKNGDDIDVSGETDVQISKAAPDASLLDAGMGETHSNTDQNKIHEQIEKEDKNGDDIDASGETNVQISEAALEASLLDAGIGETPLNTGQNKIHEQNEKEDKNGDDIDASGETDVQIPEAALDASLLDTGISETHSNTDQNKILEQNEKEDKNGDDTDVSGETDVQISEAAPDTSLHDTGIGETHSNTDQKKIHEQSEKEETGPLPDVKEDAKTVSGKRKLQMQGRWRGVDPVIFYKDESVVSRIVEFYGIKDSFPIKGHLITRNDDMSHVKRIYYISNSVKKVLELNLFGGQQLKIASVGLKMFERQTSKEGSSAPCLFRISSEGLPLILPHITKQILNASPIDFKHLLKYKSVKFPDFVDPYLREKASELMLGCCVVILRAEGWVSSGSGEDAMPIAIGCWRGRTNISVMVNANDCQELLERVSALRADDAMELDDVPMILSHKRMKD